MSTQHVVKYRRQHKKLRELSDEQTRHGFEHRIYVQRSQSEPSDPVYSDVWNLYDPYTDPESNQDTSEDDQQSTEEPEIPQSFNEYHIQVHHPHTAVGHTTGAPDRSDFNVNHWQFDAVPRDCHLRRGRGPPSRMPSSVPRIPPYGGQLLRSTPSSSTGFQELPNEHFRHARTSPAYPIITSGTPFPPQESWSHANPELHHTMQGMTQQFDYGISSSSYAVQTGRIPFPLAMQEPSVLYEPLDTQQTNYFSQNGVAQIDGRMFAPQFPPTIQSPSGQNPSSWGMDPGNMSDWTQDQDHMPLRTTHMPPSMRWQQHIEFDHTPPVTNNFVQGGTSSSSSDLQYQQYHRLRMSADTMVDNNLNFGGQNLLYSVPATLPWPDQQGLVPGSSPGNFPSAPMGDPTFHIDMESPAYPQNGYFYGSSTQKDFV